MSTAMEAEFDDVPRWTADAVDDLGPEYAGPAACRGTASPAALDWLATRCELRTGTRLADIGAGMGGPAAYARAEYGAEPVVFEPMLGACRAARRMFGLPAVAATGDRLPLDAGWAQAAWCLGVLCTTTRKTALLREVRRVLPTGGRLGLFVLVARGHDLVGMPEGNSFPTRDELHDLLDATGFGVLAGTDLADLPAAPPQWQQRADRVQQVLAAEHRDEPAWRQVEGQERKLRRLTRGGDITGHLICAAAR